ncbi:MAG: lytic transglycosylase domain-containing protein [Acidobacteria bacterium]|nr:lytic transglycosylase domain-containing protein [Acidobacteriota bacterium]
MTRIALILLCAFAALSLQAGEQKLVAKDIPGVGIRGEGRVVIKGDGTLIRAYQVDGNLSRQLVRIKSTPRSFSPRPSGPEVYDSRAEAPRGVPEEIRGVIEDASRKHGVDPRLVSAVAYRESGFDPKIVSRAGACGLMQLMPKTAETLGVTEIFDIRQNVFGGVQYLRMLLDTFSGDLDLALAAYNAGPGAVERYRGVPPYRETIEYIRRVRGDYERELGRTPRS